MTIQMSILAGLADASSIVGDDTPVDSKKPQQRRRIKRALLIFSIVLLVLGALAGAAYWRLVQIVREQMISELISVGDEMVSRTEYIAARELYTRASKVNGRSPQNAIAMEKAGSIQSAKDRQAAERSVSDRQIAEARGVLADLEMRKQALEGEKALREREVQRLQDSTRSQDNTKAQQDVQLMQLQEQIRGKASQFTELSASVNGLVARKEQLATVVGEIDDVRAKLQADVDRIKWITDFPEAMLKYHETVFKPAVRQIGDVALKLSVVVRAVDLGLKTDDYIAALIDKEMAAGGNVREAQAAVEQGRTLIAQGATSPEVDKLMKSQQAGLERIVGCLVAQCSRFRKREIQRTALNSSLGALPDDLNFLIMTERRIYESVAPLGWPVDDMPLVKEVRGTASSADIVKYLDMLDRKEAWESNVEVAYLAANPPASIRALVPGTVVLSLQDVAVRSVEEISEELGKAGAEQRLAVRYVEAAAWAKGVMTPKTLIATKKDMMTINWRTSLKKIK